MMLLSLAVLLVLGAVVTPAELSAHCHADNCYRAVAGTNVRVAITARRSDCSRLMTATTVTPASTYVDSLAHVDFQTRQ
jgi:hypothetical protein